MTNSDLNILINDSNDVIQSWSSHQNQRILTQGANGSNNGLRRANLHTVLNSFFTQYSTHSLHNVHPLIYITRLCGPSLRYKNLPQQFQTPYYWNSYYSQSILPVSNNISFNMHITAVVVLLSAVIGANGEKWSGVSSRTYLASYPEVIQGANTY